MNGVLDTLACLEGRSIENGRIGLIACRKSLPAKVGSFAQQGPVGFYLSILHIVSLEVVKVCKGIFE
jgi:hypothetical protein